MQACPSAPSPELPFEDWLGQINAACGAFQASPQQNRFSGRFAALDSGTVRLSVVEAGHTRLYRSQNDVGRSDDQKFFAVLQLQGQCGLEQGTRQAALAQGDMALVDAAQPCSILLGAQSRQVSLILPRHTVQRQLAHGRVACAQRIPADSAVAMMAGALIHATLQQSHTGLAPQEGEAVLDALVTLLKPAITLAGPTERSTEDAHQRMFRKACAVIDAHLAEDGLSPEWIAQAIGVSVRGLYRVFSRQGLVVAQYIKHRRLDLCAQALRQAAGDEKLSTLGYSWGFADSSHFSSAFKTRFGVPPGEYRKRCHA